MTPADQSPGSGVLLELVDVSLAYGPVPALSEVSLRVAAGEVTALVGSSGSGKSSLLYCMSGLIRPTGGTVALDGVDLSTLDSEGRAALRRERIGFVFQFSELVPELSLWDNIALPLELNGVARPRVRERVAQLVNDLGLADRAQARPAQVSGGQAQRAAVARAIAHRPRIIFADEPTGALDSRNSAVVLDALLTLSRREGAAVVLVTHDLAVAEQTDRVVTLADGRVVDDTPTGAAAA